MPVLAHPERYLFLDSKEFYKLKRFGCLFQANLLSTTDYYGVSIRKKLDLLLKNKLIDFVGSDIHNLRHVLAFDNKVNSKEILNLNQAIEKNNQLFR